MQEQPTVTLSLDLVNEVLSYLSNRPAGEVYGLIGKLLNASQPQLQAEPVVTQVESAEKAS